MAFNRDNKFSRRGGGGFRERPMMHKAVCDNCGKDCEVPFRPTSGKPIFCSSCFENKGSSDSRRFEQPQLQKQLEQLNNKLDQILKLLNPAEAQKITKSDLE